ncbi:MAG TPA: penicillin-binding protein 2 [Gemmatimonadaceae bacterium]|nr:penicillin-binding protein 2 [Gemmatimonadaceae bacterium]
MSFHPNEVARRGRIASFVLIAIFGALGARFFSMQILQHSAYVLQSDKNRLNEIPLPAPRGVIYDRTGQVIAENVPGYTVSILPQRRDSLPVVLDRMARLVPLSPDEHAATMRRYRQSAPLPAVVFSNATFEVVSILEEHRVEFPGLIIQSVPKRHYPDSSAASAFVGYTSEINEQELAARVDSGYRPGQQIGKSGLEFEYEAQLRGRDGTRFLEVNASGRVVREAGVRAVLAPEAGPALRTNIDMDLQRFVAKLFGDSLIGAAIALDPTTGGVLALHSAPAYDPNRFIGGVSEAYYERLRTDRRNPMYNKAVQGAYAPGSTWKLATAIMALERGVVRLNERMPVQCDGGYTFGNRRFRCWDRAGHGNVTLREALAKSCDVYFYQLGLRLGLDSIAAAGTRMLFGDRTGIDLSPESRSSFPPGQDSALYKYYVDRFRASWWRGQQDGEPLNLAIGQGANSQTVVNMARFYTALASDGYAAKPEIVARDPQRTKIFQLTPEQTEALRVAMTEVLSERGTAGSAAIRGVPFAGKTGTAQNPQDPTRDHGWFVGFAPTNEPKVVVAVLLEFGQHGYLAARVAARIVEHYLKASVAVPSTTGQ